MRRQNCVPALVILASAFLPSAAMAGGIDLASLTSNGAAGDFADEAAYVAARFGDVGGTIMLNTDSGSLSGGGFWPDSHTPNPSVAFYQLPFQTVSQNGGPAVHVFDFSTFSIPQGYSLILWGSTPAAILSQSDVTIAGPVLAID